MGTSRSVAQLGAKFEAWGRELSDPRLALNKTGMAGKQIFIASAGSVIGARVAGKRKAINARYDVRPPAVTITYTGPAHLVNNPTRPHEILARRRPGIRTRRRGARALAINGNVRARADHPGTRGKGFFERARAASIRTLPGVFARAQLTEPLRRAFR